MNNFGEIIMKRFSRDRGRPSVFRGCSLGRESFIRRKLSIFRRKKTLVPSTSATDTAAATSAVIVHHQQTVPGPETGASPSHRPSTFSLLSRRFFSGSKTNRGPATVTVSTSLSPATTANNRPPAGPSSTYQSSEEEDNVRVQVPSPQAVCSQTTVTGTISKSSTTVNCTRGFKSSITLRVISIRGGFIDVTLPITRTGRDLKLEAIGRFAVESDEEEFATANNLHNSLAKYKLVTMNRREVIDEALTLERLALRDRGECGRIQNGMGKDSEGLRGTFIGDLREFSVLFGENNVSLLNSTTLIVKVFCRDKFSRQRQLDQCFSPLPHRLFSPIKRG